MRKLIASFLVFTAFTVLQMPMAFGAYIPYQVTSNANLQRVERVMVQSGCSSSPCSITSQSGSWVSSITRSGAGTYVLNINSGYFSAAPTCVCSVILGNELCQSVTASTTTTFPFRTLNYLGGTANPNDDGFSIICMGPR